MDQKTENTKMNPQKQTGEEKTVIEDSEELLKHLPKERNSDGTYIYFYQGFWCPSSAIQGMIAFRHHFQASDSDLILTSFPKSGTTWMKAVIFTIVNRSKHALTESPLLSEIPHMLIQSFEFQIYEDNPSPDLEGIPSPRIFHTHSPYAALPSSVKDSKCRLVYICRNPLDQFISYWHFNSKLWSQTHYSISLDECFSRYCCGISTFGPFWDHILGYWKASQDMPDKVLFLKYEDLQEDIVFHTKLLAEFLAYPFSMEEERQGVVEEVSKLCSFGNLKNLEVNKTGKTPAGRDYSDFFREGKVGDWTNYLTPPMAEHLKSLIQEKFEGSGLTFKIS